MLDLAVDYQTLRHSTLSRHLRKGLYTFLVGGREWPLVFKAPAAGTTYGPEHGSSPHIYVHIPFCRTICPHCPYNKVLYNQPLYERYAQALLREIAAYMQQPNLVPIQSLYFGGGTPSMAVDLVTTVIATLRPALLSEAEVALEVYPSDAEPTLFRRLKAAGINKVSLGIETFNPDLLKQLGRRYTPDQAVQAVHTTRDAGFACVDVNLIYGIPGQQPHDPVEDTRRCIALGVDQISAYPLFTFEHTRMGQRVAQGHAELYGDGARLRSQRDISRLCRDHGYERTSVWSFTRTGVPPYTTVTRASYRGFGAGAGSKVDGVFWFNTFSVQEYSALQHHRPALVLQVNERFRRFHWLYWQIYRTTLQPSEYQQRFERTLEHDFGTLLLLLRLAGWLKRAGDSWVLSEAGAVWAHRVQSLFSLTYIDDLWKQCQREAWPAEVVLQ